MHPLATLLLARAALAATPTVAVVGLHAPASYELALQGSEELAAGLDATGQLDGLSPAEVADRIAGHEDLVLSTALLGPGRDKLKEGELLYERAAPDQAAPVLERAVELLTEAMAGATDGRDLEQALLYLGLSHLALGEQEAAAEAFSALVRMDPGRELDPVNFSPSIVSAFEEVRQQVLAQGTGSIAVNPRQEGVEVYLDGRHLGTAPQAAQDLPVGQHHLLLLGRDGRRLYLEVPVRPGKRTLVQDAPTERRLAATAPDAAGRARQVQAFYSALGEHVDADLVLLGGLLPDGTAAVQLYATHSGNFSRPLPLPDPTQPYDSALDVLPALAGYVTSTGDVRSDRVSPRPLALDVDANPVLAQLLLAPEPRSSAAAASAEPERSSRWLLWAGAGVLGAGALAGGAYWYATRDAGTITFGPVP